MTDWEIMLAAKPYSMTSGRNLLATVTAIHELDQCIDGDVVECGAWRGGHTIAAMLAASRSRTYWLFDTFAGMTEPGEHDYRGGYHATATTAYRKKGASQWCRAELLEVQTNIDQFRREDQVVRYVAGPVEDTLAGTELPDAIAFLRLDTDFYASTRMELEVLWPRVVAGGILIIDDYHSWAGCRRACDEYFAAGTEFQPVHGPAVKVVKS